MYQTKVFKIYEFEYNTLIITPILTFTIDQAIMLFRRNTGDRKKNSEFQLKNCLNGFITFEIFEANTVEIFIVN